MWRYKGEITQGKFSKELKLSRGFLRGGGIFLEKRFSMGEFYMEKLSIETLRREFPGNIFHGGRTSGMI
jgi:hypothetical protein